MNFCYGTTKNVLMMQRWTVLLGVVICNWQLDTNSHSGAKSIPNIQTNGDMSVKSQLLVFFSFSPFHLMVKPKAALKAAYVYKLKFKRERDDEVKGFRNCLAHKRKGICILGWGGRKNTW